MLPHTLQLNHGADRGACIMITALVGHLGARNSVLGAAVILTAAFGAPALGQQSAAGESAVLEEVIVTAQKRAESLQSVPVSVTALSASQLAQTKLDSPADLAAQIPNMQQQGVIGEGTPLFALRGVSMFDYSPSQSTPVGSYMDEVYKGSFVLLGVEMFDLERIEVLRGPQGTLYGKNTTGGAINFIAKKPGFETEGDIKLGVGNYNRREAEGAIQAGIIPDRLAVRMAFTYTKADGFVRNILPGHPDLEGLNQYGLRLSASLKASDDLNFLLRYSRSEQNPQNYAIISGSIAPGGIGGLGYYRTSDGTASGTPLADDQVAQDFTPRRRQRNQGVALTTNWKISSDLALTAITSWDQGYLYIPEGTDGAPIDVFKYIETGKVRQVTQDVRLTSTADSPFNYIVGAFYQHEVVFSSVENQFFNSVDVNGDGKFNYLDCADSSFGPNTGYAIGYIINSGCRYRNGYDQFRNSWAAYTDMSYKFSTPVKLRLGLRYNHDNAAQKNAIVQLLGSDGIPIGNVIPGIGTGANWTALEALPGSPNYDAIINATTGQRNKSTAVTGRVGIDYTPTDDLLAYLSFSRGYRAAAFAGQFDFSLSDLTTVPAEKLNSFEAGFKSTLAGDRLQINGAVFRYDYKNQQILDVQQSGAQPLISLGKSRIYGAELEIVSRPVRSLTVRGSLATLDARVKEGMITGGLTDAAGKTLPSSPKFSGSLAVDWEAMALPAVRLRLHGDGTYSARQYFELYNEMRISQGGYAIVNARLSLVSHDDRWEAGIWGRNLANKLYFTNEIDFQALGYDYRHRGVPRMYGLDVAYHF